MKSIPILAFLFLCVSAAAQNSDAAESALEYQRKLNESYLNPGTSPMIPEDLADFNGLEFFPVASDFYVVAEFVRTPYELPFVMPTTTGRKPMYLKYGEAYFELNGKEFKLNLYQDQELSMQPQYENHLFLPFTDLTSGESTYAGGRYIDLQIPDGNKIIIDFNKAYNPYCAYNAAISCPIPPEENHLELAVEAGVKH